MSGTQAFAGKKCPKGQPTGGTSADGSPDRSSYCALIGKTRDVLIVVSPAKSLDYESPLATKKFTEPAHLDRSAELIEVMRTKTPEQIAKLMDISPALAQLNFERYHDWDPNFTRKNSRAALLAARNSFSERDFTHAQKTLRILSGLYGVLRPLDLMMPYRLEMGTKLATKNGKDLYGFWGDTITDAIREAMVESPGEHVLVNLASTEYFGSVKPAKLDAPIVAPAFYDADKSGNPKIISFFAKRARGVMSAWIIRERITSTKALTNFEGMGYRYDKTQSTKLRPVFTRVGEAL
jgi:uncharacterized protein